MLVRFLKNAVGVSPKKTSRNPAVVFVDVFRSDHEICQIGERKKVNLPSAKNSQIPSFFTVSITNKPQNYFILTILPKNLLFLARSVVHRIVYARRIGRGERGKKISEQKKNSLVRLVIPTVASFL